MQTLSSISDDRSRAAVLALSQRYESTMSAAANASVGILLKRLAERYFQGLATYEQKSAKLMEFINAFVAAAQENSFLTEEEKGKIPEIETRFRQKLAEAPDSRDNVQIRGEGQSIPLDEVLGLVAAATLDSKELDKGKSEDDAKRDKDNRVLTLFRALQFLVDGPSRCHQGWRHDIALTLNHVWPNTHIIEDVNFYITYELQQFLLAGLQKETSQEQFLLFKSWVMPEVVPEGSQTKWEQFCANSKRHQQAIVFLKRKLFEQGLDSDKDRVLSSKIEGYVGYLEVTPVAVEWHPLAYCFSDIQALKPDSNLARKAAMEKAKNDLMVCHSFEELASRRLDEFLMVEGIYQDLKKYGPIAFGTEFYDLIQGLLRKVQSYYEAFSRDTLPERCESFLTEERKQLSQAIRKLEKEGQISFIQNFFVHWFDEGDNRKSLLEKIQAPAFLPIVCYSEEVLQQLIRQNSVDGVVALSSYQINRVLLQALLISPDQWTDSFARTIDLILAFWERDPTNLSEAERNLITTSYPDSLKKEIKILMQIYRASKGTQASLSLEEGFFIPLIAGAFPIVPHFSEIIWERVGKDIKTIKRPNAANVATLSVLIAQLPALAQNSLIRGLAQSLTLVELCNCYNLPYSMQERLMAAVPHNKWNELAQSLTFEQLFKLQEMPISVQEKLCATISQDKWDELVQPLTFEQFLGLDRMMCVSAREKLIAAVPDGKWKILAQSLTFEQLCKLKEMPISAQGKLMAAVSEDKWKLLADQSLIQMCELTKGATQVRWLMLDQLFRLKKIPIEALGKLIAAVRQDIWKCSAQSLTFEQLFKLQEMPISVQEKLCATISQDKWDELAQPLTFEQFLGLDRMMCVSAREKLIAAVPDGKWKILAQSLTFEQLLKLWKMPISAQGKLMAAVSQDKWDALAQSLTYAQLYDLEAGTLYRPNSSSPSDAEAQFYKARDKLIAAVSDGKWVEIAQSFSIEKLYSCNRDVRDKLKAAIDRIASMLFSPAQLSHLSKLPDQIQMLLIQAMDPSDRAQNDSSLSCISRLFQLVQDVQFSPLLKRDWERDPFSVDSFVGRVLGRLNRLPLYSTTPKGKEKGQMIVDLMDESLDLFYCLRNSKKQNIPLPRNGDILFDEIGRVMHLEQLMQLKSLPAKIRKPLTEAILRNPSALDRIARSEAINFDRLQQLKQLPAKIRKPLIKAISQNPSALDRIARSKELSGKEFSPQELNQIPRKIRRPFIAAMGRAVAENKMHYRYGVKVKQRSILRRMLGVVVGIGAILLGAELFLAGAFLTATLVGSPIGVPLMAAAAGVLGIGVAAVASAIGVSSAVAATTAVVATGSATAFVGTAIAASGAQEIVGTTRDLLLKHRLGREADVKEVFDGKPKSIMRGTRLHISRPFFQEIGRKGKPIHRLGTRKLFSWP